MAKQLKRSRPKLNSRQERFVREYVKNGGNGRKAYLGAGYEVNDPRIADINASRLLSSAKVNQVVAAVQARHRTRHDYTVDTILAELDESRQGALQDQQFGPAVQASTVKAKMLGMIVDRKEHGAPGDFANLDSVAAIIKAVAKELGPDIARAIASMAGESVTIDATPVVDQDNTMDIDQEKD